MLVNSIRGVSPKPLMTNKYKGFLYPGIFILRKPYSIFVTIFYYAAEIEAMEAFFGRSVEEMGNKFKVDVICSQTGGPFSRLYKGKKRLEAISKP